MTNPSLSSDALNKPTVVDDTIPTILFGKRTSVEETLLALYKGEYVLIKDLFSDGLSLLKSLKYDLKKKHPGDSFAAQRAYRSDYSKLSQQVLLEIEHHEIKAKKAPLIPWLKILYPDLEYFKLAFPQVQGLNSSWQWYNNGINIPVLRNKIYPFFGVYFPTRFDHLILFDNWLKRYDGPKKTAFDIGIGSGVLSFQLVKHGFQKVYGTDVNPNAIYGLEAAIAGTKLSRKLELQYGNLFVENNKASELIVFNPPWLAATDNIENLDHAIYYDETLFPAFFQAAKEHLLPDGKLVILFSNLGKITDNALESPMTKELETGGRFELVEMLQRPVKQASEKTKRNQSWRTDEEVELWVLQHLK